MHLSIARRGGGLPACLAVSATAMSIAALTAPAASATPGSGSHRQTTASTFTLVNAVSNRCLDDPGYVTTNGTQIDLWDCNGGANQKWTSTGTGPLAINGINKCLDVANGAAGAHTPGTRVVIWDCNGSPTQAWTLSPTQPTRIQNSSGLCLDTAMQTGGDGVPLVVWNCSGPPSQTWMAK